jgi:hypothetical protein
VLRASDNSRILAALARMSKARRNIRMLSTRNHRHIEETYLQVAVISLQGKTAGDNGRSSRQSLVSLNSKCSDYSTDLAAARLRLSAIWSKRHPHSALSIRGMPILFAGSKQTLDADSGREDSRKAQNLVSR